MPARVAVPSARSYTTCCGNLNSSTAAASGLSTATNGSAASGCSSGLAGAGVGGALRAIRDPSSPQFCTLISGSASTLKPAPQICFSLGEVCVSSLESGSAAPCRCRGRATPPLSSLESARPHGV